MLLDVLVPWFPRMARVRYGLVGNLMKSGGNESQKSMLNKKEMCANSSSNLLEFF